MARREAWPGEGVVSVSHLGAGLTKWACPCLSGGCGPLGAGFMSFPNGWVGLNVGGAYALPHQWAWSKGAGLSSLLTWWVGLNGGGVSAHSNPMGVSQGAGLTYLFSAWAGLTEGGVYLGGRGHLDWGRGFCPF